MTQHTNDATVVHVTTLDISGLTCDDCAAHVARTLEDINGVVHVDVHGRQASFVVERLPPFVRADMIAAAVQTLGYGAEVATSVPDVDDPRPTPQEQSSSCCCTRRGSTAHWANLGASTIG